MIFAPNGAPKDFWRRDAFRSVHPLLSCHRYPAGQCSADVLGARGKAETCPRTAVVGDGLHRARCRLRHGHGSRPCRRRDRCRVEQHHLRDWLSARPERGGRLPRAAILALFRCAGRRGRLWLGRRRCASPGEHLELHQRHSHRAGVRINGARIASKHAPPDVAQLSDRRVAAHDPCALLFQSCLSASLGRSDLRSANRADRQCGHHV